MRRILPIIVIYNIELKEAIAYQTLIRANDIQQFVVYDNSAVSDSKWKVYAPKAVYCSDIRNGGLSKAYNKGAEIARQLGYTHILLLDQDTRFDANAWNVYQQNLGFDGMIAPLMQTTLGANFSPVDISGFFSHAAKGLVIGEYSLYTYAVVNSGICIPVELFYNAGGYVDKVRLDFADFQFQLRLRRVQPLFRLIDTVAIQDFSNDCHDLSKIKERYKLYIESARHYEVDSFRTRFHHLCDVLKHTLSLTIRLHSADFFRLFFSYYLAK